VTTPGENAGVVTWDNKESTMEDIKERVAAAAISAVLGLLIALALLFWIDSIPAWTYGVVPLVCGVAGYVAGHRAVEVFKEIFTQI